MVRWHSKRGIEERRCALVNQRVLSDSERTRRSVEDLPLRRCRTNAASLRPSHRHGRGEAPAISRVARYKSRWL